MLDRLNRQLKKTECTVSDVTHVEGLVYSARFDGRFCGDFLIPDSTVAEYLMSQKGDKKITLYWSRRKILCLMGFSLPNGQKYSWKYTKGDYNHASTVIPMRLLPLTAVVALITAYPLLIALEVIFTIFGTSIWREITGSPMTFYIILVVLYSLMLSEYNQAFFRNIKNLRAKPGDLHKYTKERFVEAP